MSVSRNTLTEAPIWLKTLELGLRWFSYDFLHISRPSPYGYGVEERQQCWKRPVFLVKMGPLAYEDTESIIMGLRSVDILSSAIFWHSTPIPGSNSGGGEGKQKSKNITMPKNSTR